MKRLLVTLLIALEVSSTLLFCEIFKSPNLLPIAEALSRADSDTLVIFDVVDTLITCDEPIFHSKNKSTFHKVSEEFFRDLPKEKIDELMTTILNERKTSLVDPKILDLIEIVKQKHLKMVVLTSCGTGKYGAIEKMEDWRLHQLENAGLHFEEVALKDEKWIDSMTGPHGVPLLKKGVIFTAQIDQSIVLEEVLKLENLHFNKVIYVDDQLKNLKDVEAFCEREGMQFLGFEYTAVQERPVQKIDEKLIEIQLHILMREGQWISSEEAAETFNDD